MASTTNTDVRTMEEDIVESDASVASDSEPDDDAVEMVALELAAPAAPVKPASKAAAKGKGKRSADADTEGEEDVKRRRTGPGRCDLIIRGVAPLFQLLAAAKITVDVFFERVAEVYHEHVTHHMETPNHPRRKDIINLGTAIKRVRDAIKDDTVGLLSAQVQQYILGVPNPFEVKA
jgi:hypothetical protein